MLLITIGIMAAMKKMKNRDGSVMNDDKKDEDSYYKTTMHVAIQCAEFYLEFYLKILN
jgi:hypothetical protein